MAALVAGQYLGQNFMLAAMDRLDKTLTPSFTDFLITSAHSLAGLAVLALMLWRYRLRRSNPVAVGGGRMSPRLAGLARAWHLALYGSLVLMTVTGVLSYYTDIAAATRWHELGKWLLGILVIGHIVAGLTHWLVFRDQVLQQMLGYCRDADTIRSSGQSGD